LWFCGLTLDAGVNAGEQKAQNARALSCLEVNREIRAIFSILKALSTQISTNFRN